MNEPVGNDREGERENEGEWDRGRERGGRHQSRTSCRFISWWLTINPASRKNDTEEKDKKKQRSIGELG